MAHIALLNGTNYQVGGGKVMIDGTVYNIMATREVNDTVVVEMNPTSISGQVMTLENAAFDWTKYDLAEYFVFGEYGTVFVYVKTSIENSIRMNRMYTTTIMSGGYQLLTFTITENATVNGKLTINAKYSMGSSYMGWPISDKSKLVCTVILKRKG
ncbi:MAG: hypothetical protein PUF20_10945 [Clostridiales bacterium]|nr:hypothetical protein [Clostridiales bacterium]